MSYAQFVDKIDANPTVRLDVDDQVTWKLLANGTDLGTPPINRAVVSTLLTDGVRIPASAYGARTLTLSLDIKAATADAAATQFQRLARELDRPVNFLRWQPDTSQPVFFRLFRGEMTNVQFDPVLKRAVAVMLAEPFAYGLRETQAAVTVNNDPAAVSNGMFLDVTGVKGDVETPAYLEYGSVTQEFAKTLIAARRRGTPANMPFVLQAEEMTAGTDTTVQVNDLAFSGAGSNWMRCTFATTAMAKRLEITLWPGAISSVDYRGTYRVFARVRRNDATTTAMKLQLKWGVTGGTLLAGTITSSWELFASSNIALVDLGLIQFPSTEDPIHVGPTGTEIPVMRMTRIELHAQRVSGTANLDIDYLLFTPADDALLLHSHPTGSTDTTCVDGYNEVVYERDAISGGMGGSLPYQVVGKFPMLSPGETSRIVFGRTVGGGPDTVTNTTSVTVSYWPRYIYVKPAVE